MFEGGEEGYEVCGERVSLTKPIPEGAMGWVVELRLMCVFVCLVGSMISIRAVLSSFARIGNVWTTTINSYGSVD